MIRKFLNGETRREQCPGIRRRIHSRPRPTQGSETSQYLKERKSNETPPVAASEGGIAQTPPESGGGLKDRQKSEAGSRGRELESSARAGESPVPEAEGPRDDT